VAMTDPGSNDRDLPLSDTRVGSEVSIINSRDELQAVVVDCQSREYV
jgi:hypothetical protein